MAKGCAEEVAPVALLVGIAKEVGGPGLEALDEQVKQKHVL